MATVMNDILDACLTGIIAQEFTSTVNIHLFTNNITPAPTDTVGMYTDATFTSYSPQATTPFAAAAGGSGGTSSSAGTPCVFNPGVLSVPQDCYGWYMVDVSGILIAADVFAGGPKNMGGTTVSLTITPTLSLT